MTIGKLAFTVLTLIALPSFCLANSKTDPGTSHQQGLPEVARGWGEGAKTLATDASKKAFKGTSTTLRFLGNTVLYPIKTLGSLGKLFGNPSAESGMQVSASDSPRTKLVGYSPEEYKIVCSECSQETVVRGNVPGLRLTCPRCGKTLEE